MPTVVTNTIGSDVSRDFATIAAWEAATDNDLVALDEQHDGVLHDDSDFTFTSQTFSGAVVDATRFRRLRVSPGDEYDPVTDTGVVGIGSALGLTIDESFFELIGGMRLDNTVAGVAFRATLTVGAAAASVVIERVYVTFSGANTGNTIGISITSGATGTLRSCIANGVGGNMNAGIRLNAVGFIAHNCVAINVDNGVSFSVGFDCRSVACVLRNCIAMNSRDNDFQATGSADGDHLLSSDATAFGTTQFDNEVDTDIFQDPVAKDFRVKKAGNAFENGETQTPAFNDYNGVLHGAASGIWNLGAFDGSKADSTIRYRGRPPFKRTALL